METWKKIYGLNLPCFWHKRVHNVNSTCLNRVIFYVDYIFLLWQLFLNPILFFYSTLQIIFFYYNPSLTKPRLSDFSATHLLKKLMKQYLKRSLYNIANTQNIPKTGYQSGQPTTYFKLYFIPSTIQSIIAVMWKSNLQTTRLKRWNACFIDDHRCRINRWSSVAHFSRFIRG